MAKDLSGFEREEPGRGSRVPRRLHLSERNAYVPVTVGVVGVYGVAEAILAFRANASLGAYGAALVLLVLLAAVTFIGSLRESRAAGQRFYLALSLLPILTIARMALSDLPLSFLDPLLVYLLLAIALVSSRPTMGIRLELRGLRGRRLARVVLLGAVLAIALAVLALLLPLGGSAPPAVTPLLWALALAPVALLDEIWFRGILQASISRVTAGPSGWIATAAIFAAYGAPFSTPAGFLFHAAYGFLLGALAVRRDNLPITLLARTAMVVVLALLNPALFGSGVLV